MLNRIYDNIEIIKESGIPVEDLKSIDDEGHFYVDEIICSSAFRNYKGKIVDNGLVAICNSGDSIPTDYDVLTEDRSVGIIAYNINGYNFKGWTSCSFDRCKHFDYNPDTNERLVERRKMITDIYDNYERIVDYLDSNFTDESIKEAMGLDSFSSKKIDAKVKTK